MSKRLYRNIIILFLFNQLNLFLLFSRPIKFTLTVFLTNEINCYNSLNQPVFTTRNTCRLCCNNNHLSLRRIPPSIQSRDGSKDSNLRYCIFFHTHTNFAQNTAFLTNQTISNHFIGQQFTDRFGIELHTCAHTPRKHFSGYVHTTSLGRCVCQYRWVWMPENYLCWQGPSPGLLRTFLKKKVQFQDHFNVRVHWHLKVEQRLNFYKKTKERDWTEWLFLFPLKQNWFWTFSSCPLVRSITGRLNLRSVVWNRKFS